MKVSLVTANGNARDGALFIALSRLCPGVQIIAPAAPVSAWPQDVQVERIRTNGSNWTRQWMRGLKNALEAHDPDLIHVHNEPWAVTTQRLLRTGRPVVIHAAESVLADAPLAYRIRRAGLKSALRRCAGYVSWGETGLRATEEVGLPSSTPRAVISASPPDPSVFARVPMPEHSDRLRLIFVGRLVPEKGVATILQAMAVPHRRDKVSLTVVGGGPLRKALSAQAAECGVGARFVGTLDAAGTHAAIASGDVLLCPSIDTPKGSEQWGRVVVEAMMTGRSVLASDAGELPRLVGQHSWIFRQNDPESLGRALDTLIDDPSLVRRRGDAAYERSQLFRPDVLADELIGFWAEVLERWHASHCPS